MATQSVMFTGECPVCWSDTSKVRYPTPAKCRDHSMICGLCSKNLPADESDPVDPDGKCSQCESDFHVGCITVRNIDMYNASNHAQRMDDYHKVERDRLELESQEYTSDELDVITLLQDESDGIERLRVHFDQADRSWDAHYGNTTHLPENALIGKLLVELSHKEFLVAKLCKDRQTNNKCQAMTAEKLHENKKCRMAIYNDIASCGKVLTRPNTPEKYQGVHTIVEQLRVDLAKLDEDKILLCKESYCFDKYQKDISVQLYAVRISLVLKHYPSTPYLESLTT